MDIRHMNKIILSTLSTQKLSEMGSAIFFREGGNPGSCVVGYFLSVNDGDYISTDYGTLIPMYNFTHAISLSEFNAIVFAK